MSVRWPWAGVVVVALAGLLVVPGTARAAAARGYQPRSAVSVGQCRAWVSTVSGARARATVQSGGSALCGMVAQRRAGAGAYRTVAGEVRVRGTSRSTGAVADGASRWVRVCVKNYSAHSGWHCGRGV